MSKIKNRLKLGQKTTVEAENIGMNGEGIARFEQLTVFCNGLLPGEKAQVKITEVRKNFARAQVVELLTKSDQRIDSPCPYFPLCGGCSLQHLSYKSEVDYKNKDVLFRLKDEINEDTKISPPIKSELEFYYRNRIQLPVRKENEDLKIGLFATGSHNVVDIENCLLQSDLGNSLFRTVKKWLIKANISVYDERKHKGLLRHIMIRTNNKDNQALLYFIINGQEFPLSQEKIQEWQEAFPQLKGIILNINEKRGNTILGQENILLWGSDEIEESIGPAQFQLKGHSFFQINRFQTEKLFQLVAEHVKKIKPEHILDAYCGVGAIGITVAKMLEAEQGFDLAKMQITGVEIDPQAVEQAKTNAINNGLKNTEYIAGACEEIIPNLVAQGLRPDCVIFDPPRQGCRPEFLEAIITAEIEHIIYVSCNPITLARDIKILQAAGYHLNDVQAVDMFPRTTHVESVVLMSRVEK
ncbi:MAG: 23S rRNA (uracil(1939)-C(5))-methyltransferase RlmD [Firmicutes bacterium]|nr:23S rRNA (uracil(1939)-C(5))-methyltransferase RlmD [Bacillota bacterium]